MEKSQNLSGAKIVVVPANMTLLTWEKFWGQKSWGMYCSLHNKKYGQIGISLSPKMGRGWLPPREAEHNICS